MNKGNIIAKGKYNYPRDERLAYVTDYLIVRENGKKHLVLRFFNPRNETLNSLRFKLEQLDSEGKTITVSYVALDRLNGGAEGVFVPERKIGIAADCVDFKVTVSQVGYGSYIYSIVGGEVRVEYVEAQDSSANVSDIKSKTGGKNLLIKHRRFGFSLLICLFSVLLVACITVFTVLQLNKFKETENSFSIEKVEYTFIDGDKSENGTLSVTGYSGNNSAIVIPAAIAGYRITEIASGAFEGNNKIQSITFSDTIDVGEGAFADCSNLKSVDFANVNSIGQRAFENCTSLTALESRTITAIGKNAFAGCTSLQHILLTNADGAENVISISENAFGYCSGLEEIIIKKTVKYDDKCTIFNHCTNVTYLRLKDLGTFNNTVPVVTQLFDTTAAELGIQQIILDECDEISERMFSGLSGLTDLTIYNCKSSYIGNYAFSDCKSFNGLHLSIGVTGVGNYAFMGSGLTSFDFSSVTEMGKGAFKNCKHLVSVETLKSSPVSAISAEAFRGCSKLNSVSLPASTTIIGSSAFRDCNSLREFIFPSNGSLTAIEDTAFYNCTSLERISLPSTVTEVGGYAFLNCTSAVSLTIPSLRIINAGTFKNCSTLGIINIPDGVTEIAESAFAQCTELKSLSLPDSLNSIGSEAFSDCKNITEITVPDTVKSIGYAAFRNCDSLCGYTAPYVGGSLDDNNYLQYVFGGFIDSPDYVPESLDTITITSSVKLPDYAFASCKNLIQINLPDVITQIGDYAFSNCKGLTQIELPDQLSAIGQYAFAECANLGQLNFPDGLSSFGDYAFFNCANLSGLVVPDNVQSMGYAAFKGCSGLETLSLPFIGKSYNNSSYLAYNFGYSNNVYNTIPKSLNTITITKATTLGQRAFYGDESLTQINLPDSLRSLGDYAFSGCSSLSELTIPDGVNTMGLGVFKGCNSLETLTVPFVGQSYAYNCFLAYNFGYQSYYAYDYAPQSLKSITVTGSTTIGDYAFYSNKYITQVNLPDSVTRIGSSAFADCSRLNRINLPKKLTAISSGAFSSCYRLYEVKNDSSLSITEGSYSNGGVAQYALKVYSSIESEARRAETDGYEFIELDGVWYLVAYPYGSESLVLPERFNTSYGNVTEYNVAQYLFYYDKDLSEVTLPASVNGLGANTFESCSNLIKVYIDSASGITSLPTNCFSYCTSLTSVDLPSGLVSIKSGAFNVCRALEYITIAEGVTEIQSGAFNNCFKLREVFNESSLEIVKGSTGNGDVARWAIAVYTPENQWPRATFFTTDGVNFAYFDGEYTVVGCDSSLTEIDFGTFIYGNRVISSYSIAPGAFYNNGNLLAVNFGYGVKSIEENAFSYCKNISKVTFSGSALTEIGNYAFGQCESIESLMLPEGVTSIGSNAFYNCKGLSSVTLPSTLETINNYAFNGCEALIEVFNGSSLKLVKGSTLHGNVARYALFIYSSANAQSLLVQTDEFTFAYLDEEWVLYKPAKGVSFDSGVCTLPDSFDYYGKTISAYAITTDVFSNTYLNEIIIPTSVTSIADYALDVFSIYYCGTEGEWNSLTGGNIYKFSFDVYYYDDCVHEHSHWTYGENGEIIDNVQSHYVTTVESTCISEGELNLVCDRCFLVLSTSVIPKTTHSLDENGVCTMCGDEGLILTQDNLGDLGLINDDMYPYVLWDDGVFSSTNVKAGSTSTLTIKTDREMQIMVWFDLVGEDSDCLTLGYNGLENSYYADYSDYISIYLNSYDKLTITFTCGYADLEERGVTIKLKLYFLSEEAA